MNLLLPILLIAVLSAPVAAAPLTVVTTTPDLAAIAKEVGKDRIEVTSMASGVQDPHFLDPRPSFLVKLNKADLLIEGGLELESGWLPALLDSARNPRLRIGAPGHLDASQGIQALGVPTGSVDRSQGDVHGKGNPHYLMDPMNGVIVAEAIAKRLCSLDATGCAAFTSNAQSFRGRVESNLSTWMKRLAPYQGAKIVVYHDSWPYFTKRFGLTTVGYVEPKPGVPPPPSHVAELSNLMKRERVRVIMMEPYHERSIPDLLARQTGATVLVLAPTVGATPGTDDYVALFETNVASLVAALSSGGSAAK